MPYNLANISSGLDHIRFDQSDNVLSRVPMSGHSFSTPHAGVPLNTLAPGVSLPRHRHCHGYVAIVLDGSYIEAGDTGRYRVEPGYALQHGVFDAHRNDINTTGATVLNLPLPKRRLPSAFRVADPDELAMVAADCPHSAADLIDPLQGTKPEQDWPDLLAAELAVNARLSISEWASAMGLAPATVSRGFRRLYGTSPIRFRTELRAKAAVLDVMNTGIPLAAIAYDHGYADQAHLTRAVTSFSGYPPRAWRAMSNGFKKDHLLIV